MSKIRTNFQGMAMFLQLNYNSFSPALVHRVGFKARKLLLQPDCSCASWSLDTFFLVTASTTKALQLNMPLFICLGLMTKVSLKLGPLT